VKCTRCKAKAEVHLRAHNAGFCRPCYLEYFRRHVERAVKHERMFGPGDRILVAVSGGKDSLALWDVLAGMGHQTTGLYLGLGIGAYSDRSREKVEAFATARGLPLVVRSLAAEGPGLAVPDVAASTRRMPCAACGAMKRHFFDAAAHEGAFDVLATGHNLDDEVAVLMQNTLRWQTGYLARQAPVLPASREGLTRKVKPFCRFYERETATYALVRSIDYVYEECPHAVGNLTNFYKTLLNQLETQSPGAKLGFYLEFLRARGEGAFEQFNKVETLHACETCGQPTSAPGRCAFCRMWDIEKLTSAVVQ